MNIVVDHGQGRFTVTIVRMEGDLDASNYEELIARCSELHASGARDAVLDLRMVALGHNTVRGAAGGSVLNAELLAVNGALDTA